MSSGEVDVQHLQPVGRFVEMMLESYRFNKYQLSQECTFYATHVVELRLAVNRVVASSPSLRSRFWHDGNEWMRGIGNVPAETEHPFEHERFSPLTPCAPFRWSVRGSGTDSILRVDAQHSVMDGRSWTYLHQAVTTALKRLFTNEGVVG